MPLHERTFLGHPVGLYILFFTEMWERFSYYGMRALLVLYLTNYLKWEQASASTTYKCYTTLVYVTPIIGGYLADRYLGNAWAVIIGASLMALGHFLMAFEADAILMSALALLIVGNGFFKPNMATQVGRLYPANDSRRDAAYTIFYMGINLGAFLSPLLCGWLALNTVGEYHAGFTAAGIGMVLGLLTYVFGRPLVIEVDAGQRRAATEQAGPATEAEAAKIPSLLPGEGRWVPKMLAGLAVLLTLLIPVTLWMGLSPFDAAMLGITGLCMGVMAFVTSQVRNALVDRVLTILALGVFIVVFWGAFEQAGNPQNLWADQSTNRFLTEPMPEGHDRGEIAAADETIEADAPRPTGLAWFTNLFRLKPQPQQPEQTFWQWLTSSLNPVPTESFQSINPGAIFVLAPLFAWMWVALDRRGRQPSIPLKMAIGLAFMSASMAVMVGAVFNEQHPTSISWAQPLPAGIEVHEGKVGIAAKDGFRPFHAGRLEWKPGSQEMVSLGVLPIVERDRIVGATAPQGFQEFVEKLAKKSELLKVDETFAERLPEEPQGFDRSLSGVSKDIVSYEPDTQTFVVKGTMQERVINELKVAAGHREFKTAVTKLSRGSQTFRVSPWWLFWSYVLATLGELCLSPVGLSMVSKLAPAKHATMVMGVWQFLTGVGNWVAGLMGEQWGRIPPLPFFLLLTVAVAAAAGVLLLLVRLVTRMMHGVN